MIALIAQWAERGQRRRQHPDQPWLWRRDWAEGAVRDASVATPGCVWAAAILWNLFTLPLWFIIPARAQHEPLFLIAALFPLSGLFLLFGAVWQSLRLRKYGVSLCRLPRVPVPVGSTCKGEIETRLRDMPPAGFVVRLSSVRRTVHGTGKNRRTSEAILWQEEQTVTHPVPGPHGLRVPFRFRIPRTCSPTDERHADDRVIWRLEAQADVPGIDFESHFELPVFGVSEEADFEPAPAPPLRPGETITFRGAQSFREWFSFLTSIAFWFGALVLFRNFGAPQIVLAVFGAIGVAIVLYALNFAVTATTLTADRTTLTIHRTRLGLGRRRTIPASEVQSMAVEEGTRLGTRTHHTLRATLRSGRSITLARHIPTRWEGEEAGRRLMGAMGK